MSCTANVKDPKQIDVAYNSFEGISTTRDTPFSNKEPLQYQNMIISLFKLQRLTVSNDLV